MLNDLYKLRFTVHSNRNNNKKKKWSDAIRHRGSEFRLGEFSSQRKFIALIALGIL